MKTLLLSTFALALTAMSAAAGPYRHVVMFQFKKDASPEAVREVEKAFVALKDQIGTIKDLEWGKNVSPENHDQGLTHVFFLTFDDRAGLDVYLPHPAHTAFVEKLKPVLEKATVLDYVASKE